MDWLWGVTMGVLFCSALSGSVCGMSGLESFEKQHFRLFDPGCYLFVNSCRESFGLV